MGRMPGRSPDRPSQHDLGRRAVGEQGAHDGSGAGADVNIEVVDGAIGQDVVDGAQRADFVHRAGQAAAGQHESRFTSMVDAAVNA